MIYKSKPKGVIEFLFVFSLFCVPFALPTLFLFKSPKKEIQRVAIPPQRLGWAKLWMFASGGLWWIYLRYFAKQCPNCTCVWYGELTDSNVLDVQNEEYTYKDKIETLHYANQYGGAPVSKSETKIDKVGVKTITTSENTYRCVNCGHIHSLVEQSQDLASSLNQLKN